MGQCMIIKYFVFISYIAVVDVINYIIARNKLLIEKMKWMQRLKYNTKCWSLFVFIFYNPFHYK